MEYGSYYYLDCEYLVHVKCATDGNLWDEITETKDENQKLNGNLGIPSEELVSITCVFKEMKFGDNAIATEIKHFSHEHNLILSNDIMDGICCDGCMRYISTSFYYCVECGYSLHKSFAELPRKMRHWGRRGPKALHYYSIFLCDLCGFYCSGFGYIMHDVPSERVCIRCFQVPDYFTTQGHKHPLLFDRKCRGECSICGIERCYLYRCEDSEYFSLCWRCIVMPQTTWIKHDEHPLALTYHDDSDEDQCYCDICEEPRDPNKWFYHCKICEYSVHSACVLGKSPYVKLGLTFTYDFHPHPLTFVREDFNYFPCNDCGKRCKDVFLKCTESECKYSVHLDCRCCQVMNKKN